MQEWPVTGMRVEALGSLGPIPIRALKQDEFPILGDAKGLHRTLAVRAGRIQPTKHQVVDESDRHMSCQLSARRLVTSQRGQQALHVGLRSIGRHNIVIITYRQCSWTQYPLALLLVFKVGILVTVGRPVGALRGRRGRGQCHDGSGGLGRAYPCTREGGERYWE